MGQKLGQHFLKDVEVLQYMSKVIQGFFDEKKSEIGYMSLLEIGPGRGALTKYIKNICDNFMVVEKDEMMKPYLKNILEDKQIIWGDILNICLNVSIEKGNKIKEIVIVGNLPYYITSPILRTFFEVNFFGKNINNFSQYFLGKKRIIGGVFLIQKEVADKVRSDARKKSYLRRLLNYKYDIEYLYTVSSDSFDPPPKVDSAIIRLTFRKKKALKSFGLYKKMKVFLDIISMYKRKTLGKIIKMRKKDLDILGIKIPKRLEKRRLEELGWEEMKKIL